MTFDKIKVLLLLRLKQRNGGFAMNRNKKSVWALAIVLIFTMALALAGCGGKSTPADIGAGSSDSPGEAVAPADSADAATGKILRLAFLDNEDGYASDAVKAFAAQVEAKTEGRYTVEIGWAGALGNPAEYYDMVTAGLIDIAYFIPALNPGVFPQATIMDLPWHFPSSEASTAGVNGLYEAGFIADEGLKAVKIINMHSGPGDNIISSKPVNTVADLKNMKIIGTGGEVKVQEITALGGVPVSVDHAEQYSTLQKGVAEANLAPWLSVAPWKLEEVTKYCAELYAGNTFVGFIMNQGVFDGMSADDQKLFMEAVDETLPQGIFDGYAAICEQGEKAFVDAGGTVTQFSDADIEQISKDWAPIFEDWAKQQDALGFDGKDALDKMYQILKDQGVENPAYGYTP
jgi:TRAP-type C4-dicarboxylate transport system substrate-binding protein